MSRPVQTLATGHYFEAPRWRDGFLWMVDSIAHSVFRISAEGSCETVLRLNGIPAGLGFLPTGDLIITSMLERVLLKGIRDQVTTYADLSTVSRYLRSNAELIQDATFLDVPARLARVLLELAGSSSDGQLPPPGAVIPDKMKQSELASLVGATRESINKWLGSFEKQGLISYDRGQITLLRPSGLKQRIY